MDKDIVWEGSEELIPFLRPIDSLIQDQENARTHPDRNMEAIKNSLIKFGQTKPVLIKRGVPVIVAGNGTHIAALSIPWTHLAAVPVRADLSDAEVVALGLADNETAVLAEWDFKKVADLLQKMPAELRAFTGFAPWEIEPLLRADWTPRPESGGTDAPAGVVTYKATLEQAQVISRAISKLRESEGGDVTDGRGLELICADFLAGA